VELPEYLSNRIPSGMNHEFEQSEWDEKMKELSQAEGINVEMAYDGLCIPISL